MKKLITSINSATKQAVIAVMSTCINAISLDDGKRQTWVRLGKYGEYPGAINMPGGGQRKGSQVMDREGAQLLKDRFYSVINQVAHLGRGLPIYEGHPDEPSWRKLNPLTPLKAVGRIKEVELREDGPWALTSFNDQGVALIGGDDPQLSAHSPRFQMAAMPGQPNKFRIVGVLSLGLTNDPNMPDTAISLNEKSADPETGEVKPNDQTMKLNTNIMKRLGINPEASEEVTITTVNTVLDERDTLTTSLQSKEGELTAANERITTLTTESNKFRDKLIDHELSTAINTGKITEADKPKWEAALKTDFDGESAKLGKLMGTSVNTKGIDLSKRKEEGQDAGTGITAINSAVSAYAKEHDLDTSKPADYTAAFNGARAAKPELFE